MTDRAPERWKYVSEEPTQKMIAELKSHLSVAIPSFVREDKAREILRKVLAAAPPPPALSVDAKIESLRRQADWHHTFGSDDMKAALAYGDKAASLLEAQAARVKTLECDHEAIKARNAENAALKAENAELWKALENAESAANLALRNARSVSASEIAISKGAFGGLREVAARRALGGTT